MPNYTYKKDIPDAPNNPSDDQPIMKDNANSISDILTLSDHFGFNAAGNLKAGRHKQVTLTNEVSPLLVEGDLILYSKIASGQSSLWAKNSAFDFPLFTGKIQGGSANGFVSLYGAILIQWGLVTTLNPKGSITQVTFLPLNTDFPVACWNVQLTGIYTSGDNIPSANNIFVKDGSVLQTGFQVVNSSSSTGQKFYWVAIGQ